MTLLTNNVKAEIYKKITSGKHIIWLTEYSKVSGQHIIIFPSDEALKEGAQFTKEIIPVRLPDIPRPGKMSKIYEHFNKESGSGYKQGRFVSINDSLLSVLKV